VTNATRAAEQDNWQASLGLLPAMPQLPAAVREALLNISGLQQLALQTASLPWHADAATFATAALHALDVGYRIEPDALCTVPQYGPVIIAANHPLGGLDGLIAMAALLARRSDLKILAHGVLARLEPLATCVLPVNPYSGTVAARANVLSARAALRHVTQGGALLIFPAGEVSHLQLPGFSITDPPWQEPAGRIMMLAEAPVVPMHFSGRNSLAFQLSGLAHARLRTLLLPRELQNKRGLVVQVHIGQPINARRITDFDDPLALLKHVRASCYLLEHAPAGEPAMERVDRAPSGATLIEAVAPTRLAAEVAALGPDSLLGELGNLQVHVATATQIPWTLQEIGRLRELAFRAVGEGTGRAADIDIHDGYYEHLFVWNPTSREIVGGYRIGRIDLIRRQFGNRGLYLHSLFEFREPFFALLGPALELGRSFVRPEYQRSFAPLMLLWKGICEFVARNPRYVRLIGPASISSNYDQASRALLVQVLRAARQEPLLAPLVRARCPFRARYSLHSLFGSGQALPSLQQLAALIEDHEPDGKGLPVLLRQYLKLGARAIGFNVDAAFGDALDCLIMVDLRRVPAQTLRKYLSANSLQRLRNTWRPTRLAAAQAED
jgi:putative hemolysin